MDATMQQDVEDEEAVEVEEAESERPELTHEQRKRINDRFFKKFRRLVNEYEASISRPPESAAEASLLCSLYSALHVVFARAAGGRLLEAPRFRELVSRLIASWTAAVWKSPPSHLRDEVEENTGCATISLAAVTVATSPQVREQAGEQDEYDADLFLRLSTPLRELRPTFLDLKADLEAGKAHPRWTKCVEEYTKSDPEPATPLSKFAELDRRYEVWHLDEKSPLQRMLKKESLLDSYRLENGVLRVRAQLPDSMCRLDLLSRLLYHIHGGVDTPAAIIWENARLADRIRKLALVLIPDHKAALEVTCYANRRLLLRHCFAGSGTSTGGVSLMNCKTVEHKQSDSSSEAELLDQARKLIPELFDRR